MRNPKPCFVLALLVAAGCAQEAVEAPSQEPYEEAVALITAGGEANVTRAIELLQQVVAADSTFAPAWLQLAQTHYNLGPNGSVLPPERTLVAARDAAERAVRFAPGDPIAHLALGNVLAADWDWAEAEAEFQRALEIDPNVAGARGGLATIFFATNRRAEAREVLEPAITAAPEGGNPYNRYVITGQADRWIEIVSDRVGAAGATPNPNDLWTLARIQGGEGRYEEAIAQLERQIPLMNGDIPDEMALLGYLNGRLGRREEAIRALGELDRLAQEGRYVSPVQRAWVHLGLGENDDALALLAEGVEAHAHRAGTAFVMLGFIFEPIASDPRFIELLGRMGLPAQEDPRT